MRPRLTSRGIQVLLVIVAYVLCGAWLERPYLVSLGGVALVFLLVERVRAAGRAARLAAGDLRLAWRTALPEGRRSLEAGRPFDVEARLYAEGPSLGWASLSAYASSSVDLRDSARVGLVAGEAGATLTLIPHAAGNWWLHGALLTLEGGLGLFSARAFFPAPLRLRVLPPMPSTRISKTRTVPALRAGYRRRWLPGTGSDLAEIREATPSDPYRHVAWKATARTRRLMVRRFQTETSMDHVLCLDLAMRSDPPGREALDRSISALTAFARASLLAGDRVGLVVFDDRVRFQLEPREGIQQMSKLLDIVLDARSRPDEASVSDTEAVGAVARYLYWLEGAALRRPAPPLSSPLWADLHAGPHGDLYDARQMDLMVRRILKRESPELAKGVSSDIERVRLLLRVRGIEATRRPLSREARLQGLGDALRVVESKRCRSVVWTDLAAADLATLPALRRARRRRTMILHAAA